MSSGSKPSRDAISSLEGFVPSSKRLRRIVPVSALRHQSSPTLSTRCARSCAERIHAQMFADTLEGAGLDNSYGAYLDQIPGVTLATVNLMSLCGLHRRRRGAIVGHLALFEMTSAVPNRRYAAGFRRLGFDDRTCAFFDEHVVADSVHESVAAVDLAGGLVKQDPTLAGQVLWGARALVEVEARWARHILEAWEDGRTSLLPAVETAAV